MKTLYVDAEWAEEARTADLSSVTAKTYTVTEGSDGGVVLTFEEDLTSEEIQALSALMTRPAAETDLRIQAEQAMTELRNIAAFSGTATNAQLTNAVRTLARVEAALVQLVLDKIINPQ